MCIFDQNNPKGKISFFTIGTIGMQGKGFEHQNTGKSHDYLDYNFILSNLIIS